ncbi:hypothetical protein IQ07DRAFT_639913 [Pyrenochaeta sp. DS3sAY3a]|nr:hypothetical protein IQ07DRAFT_639913 [Pyrenochaeta sp. DS3sAY3a]
MSNSDFGTALRRSRAHTCHSLQPCELPLPPSPTDARSLASVQDQQPQPSSATTPPASLQPIPRVLSPPRGRRTPELVSAPSGNWWAEYASLMGRRTFGCRSLSTRGLFAPYTESVYTLETGDDWRSIDTRLSGPAQPTTTPTNPAPDPAPGPSQAATKTTQPSHRLPTVPESPSHLPHPTPSNSASNSNSPNNTLNSTGAASTSTTALIPPFPLASDRMRRPSRFFEVLDGRDGYIVEVSRRRADGAEQSAHDVYEQIVKRVEQRRRERRGVLGKVRRVCRGVRRGVRRVVLCA